MNRRHFLNVALGAAAAAALPAASPRTVVAIDANQFRINGRLTYAGRHYQSMRIEGLLMNARMVQAIFDDLNPETSPRWQYPDTHRWDPERNTREFIAAMPTWRDHGLLSFTINLQGGTPEAGARSQPWENSAFNADGSLRPSSMNRLQAILDRADELGMVPIVGYFYVGQDRRLHDEAAVKRAVENATGWLLNGGYRNLLIEIANEAAPNYHHSILRPARIHELIQAAQSTRAAGFRFPVGTSMTGGAIPTPQIVRASDFLLLHGNGVNKPEAIANMVRRCRSVKSYRPMPILFNEDDHADFEQPNNNLFAAIREHASWGFLDQGKNNYKEGFQSPPVDWTINTNRKKAFFNLLAQIVGA